MKVIKATKSYSKEISKLMLVDLEDHSSKFPQEMMNKFREHAQEKNILLEFENLKTIAFLAIEERRVIGFIVGYETFSRVSMIQYITAENDDVKRGLLKMFLDECKRRKIGEVITDTFEFMSNNDFLRSNGFVLTKREKLSENLEMLWYMLDIK